MIIDIGGTEEGGGTTLAFNLSFVPDSSGTFSPVIDSGGTDVAGVKTLGFSFSLAAVSSLVSPGVETASVMDGAGDSGAGAAGSGGAIGTRAFMITFPEGAAGVPVSAVDTTEATGGLAGGVVPPGGGTGTGGRLMDIGGADFRVSKGVIDIRVFGRGLSGAGAAVSGAAGGGAGVSDGCGSAVCPAGGAAGWAGAA